MSTSARITFIAASLVIAFGAYVVGTWPQDSGSAYSALASPYCASIHEDARLGAKAAYAEDLTTGKVIFSKNDSTQLPFASLTKLMTVSVANESLKANDQIVITEDALAVEGGGLSVGEIWRAEDLIDYTMIASVNDGAHALALAAADKRGGGMDAFIARMNQKAAELGLSQTYFTNDTGLDVSESLSGSYGSARDAARLIAYVVSDDPRLIERSAEESKTFSPIVGQAHVAKNTSSVSPELTGIIASKTGFTDLAGGNLAVIVEPIPGHPVAAAVLGSTREGRDEDMKALTESAKRYLTRVILCQTHD